MTDRSYPGSRLKVRSYNTTAGIVVRGPDDPPILICPECLKEYDERDGHECEEDKGGIMTFEKAIEDFEANDNAYDSDDEIVLGNFEMSLAKHFYRAGLLHAAEQDDGLAKMNKHLGASQYEYSAVCHREAAGEVK